MTGYARPDAVSWKVSGQKLAGAHAGSKQGLVL